MWWESILRLLSLLGLFVFFTHFRQLIFSNFGIEEQRLRYVEISDWAVQTISSKGLVQKVCYATEPNKYGCAYGDLRDDYERDISSAAHAFR